MTRIRRHIRHRADVRRPLGGRRGFSDHWAERIDRVSMVRERIPRLSERAEALASSAARALGHEIEPAAPSGAREAPEWLEAGYADIRLRGPARPTPEPRPAPPAPADRAPTGLALAMVLCALGALAATQMLTANDPPHRSAAGEPPIAEARPPLTPATPVAPTSAPAPKLETAAIAPRRAPRPSAERGVPAEIETHSIAPPPPSAGRAGAALDAWSRAAVTALPEALRGRGADGAARLIALRLAPDSLVPNATTHAPRGAALFVAPNGGCARRDLYYTAADGSPEGLRLWGLGHAAPAPCPAEALPVSPGAPTAAHAISTTAAAAPPPRESYLKAHELRTLLATRPLKCVADAEADCAERALYNLAASQVTRTSRLSGDARLEINAAFSIEHDAICHTNRGLSALVVGLEAPTDQAMALERRVAERHRARSAQRICHRVRRIWRTDGGEAFVADAVRIDPTFGPRPASERSDPRPFLLVAAPVPERRPG